MRTKKNIIILFLIAVLLSCSSPKEVKVDTSGISTTATAMKKIEMIKEAYIKKNMDQIKDLINVDTYRLLKLQLKNFDEATLTFNPIWVEISKETIQLTCAWEGNWKLDKKVTKERGVAIFVLQADNMKLSQILRSSPFIFPQ
ncbi:MAG: hypothetical protein HQK91_05105 [Nitrospirae bacterium]|nr:hypothetical protein [Nitrospirota bacterium]MBF0540811.1 hypothetical protein [Nitrospirota bacterium]